MTTEIAPEQLLEQFKLPPQDLAALSFCANSRPASVKSWAEALPAPRVSHTSVLLYRALPEICRLKTSSDNRLEMLEALRPYVQQCIQGLSKEFLNKPLILPEGPLKTAVVAQALQKHMSVGYCLVLRSACHQAKKGGEAERKLAVACHRAISGAGMLLLRGYQLYTQIPSNLWWEIHGLYRIARHFRVGEMTIPDHMLAYAPSSSINQAYLRVLLLACARPNQIRQQDVSATYDVLESWCQLARIQATDQQRQDNLFLVNLSSDLPPLYKSRFSGESKDDIHELDLSQLLAALRKGREQQDEGKQALPIPHTISPALLEHLVNAWGVTQQRSFAREASKEQIEACVGLSNIHAHTLNGLSFKQFLGQDLLDEENIEEEVQYTNAPGDPWVSSFGDEFGVNDEENESSAPLTPSYQVRIVDKSPGGYCLEWREVIPSQVRAGELLGLREKGRHRWGLGVIRWVQQQRGATRMGIQLLAPKTTPYAAAIEQAGGGFSDYMRVLMLPELKAANQTATLITANVPFQEYNRLRLNANGEVRELQLARRIFTTGSISQFTFRDMGSSEAPNEGASSEDYSSSWE